MTTKSDLTKLRASVEAVNITLKAPLENWWKPQGTDGVYLVRILPPIEASGVWYHQTAQYKIGRRFFYAPYIIGKPDPIFNYYRNSFKEGNTSQLKLARQLKPRKQYLCNIVVREENGEAFHRPKSVFVLSMGQQLFDLVMSYFWDSAYGDITDVYRGFDVRIVKKQQDGVTDYSQTVVQPQSSQLANDEKTLHQILRCRHELEGSIEYSEPQVLQAALDEYLQAAMQPSV